MILIGLLLLFALPTYSQALLLLRSTCLLGSVAPDGNGQPANRPDMALNAGRSAILYVLAHFATNKALHAIAFRFECDCSYDAPGLAFIKDVAERHLLLQGISKAGTNPAVGRTLDSALQCRVPDRHGSGKNIPQFIRNSVPSQYAEGVVPVLLHERFAVRYKTVTPERHGRVLRRESP